MAFYPLLCVMDEYDGGPTAGVTGKRGTWRGKPPAAESAVWGR